jgi:hypothetical protein
LKKPITKIGLVEGLKVKALSSSLSTVRKKNSVFILVQKVHQAGCQWLTPVILAA